MKRDRYTQIGFSQRIRLEWLEYTVNLINSGKNAAEINDALQNLLEDKVSIGGSAIRGNREKIISILLKVWLKGPKELEDFRDDGLELLKNLPNSTHIAVHWGMIMATYPFLASVAGNTGRLLNLQETASAYHIQRRVRELYGERETVSRAARRVLRSFMDWEVLSESGEKGIYCSGKTINIEDSHLGTWLIEASLHSQPANTGYLRDLMNSTSLFPFKFGSAISRDIQKYSSRMEILSQDRDDLVIHLK